MRDDTEFDRPVVGCPAVVVFGEPDGFTNQCFADVDRVAAPADLAIVAHAPDRLVRPVMGLAQNPVEAPRRDGVMIGRRVVAKGLMRALLVVETLEGAQALELL